MSKLVSVDKAYVAYRKALQDFYALPQKTEDLKMRGTGRMSSADVEQLSQSVLDQSRNFGDALVTALEKDKPDKRELISWKLMAAAASDLNTASFILEFQGTNIKSKRLKTRSAFNPMSSLKEILEVPMATGIYGLTQPITRRAVSDNPDSAKEQLRKTIETFLDEIPDSAASMSETAVGKVISAGLVPVQQIVSGIAGKIVEHLPTAASIILQHAASLLAEAVRKIEAALGKGLTDRVKDEITSWLNDIIEKHDTITKLLNRLYETNRIGGEIKIYIDSAPDNTSAECFNQINKAIEDLMSRYSITKKVLEGVLKVLDFVETPLLAAVPWGPVGVYGTYFGVLTYAIFSGGDYLDWYRLNERAWLNRVSGLRTTVRNSLKMEEYDILKRIVQVDSHGKFTGVSIHKTGERNFDILQNTDIEDSEDLNIELEETRIYSGKNTEMDPLGTDWEFPTIGIDRNISKRSKAGPIHKEIREGEKRIKVNTGIRIRQKHVLIEEKIRMDVQTPEKVLVGKTFYISVAIRQPESLLPEEPGMPKVISKYGNIFRESSEDIIRYRVKISAPECEVHNSEAIFLLKSGNNSEEHYFQLTAKSEGNFSILVQAYQEDGMLAADTHISITASLDAKLIKSKENRNMIKTKILFFASNPQNTNILDLGEEARSITRKIRESEYRDSLEFVTSWAARPTDLLDEMNKHNPNILHFSGHGSGEEGLVFMNDNGKSELVSTDALKTLFSEVKNNIRLVVFNACFSSVQGKAISRIIECVVGMNKSIGDEAAITFAAYFYSALAYGRSVKDAFAQGKTALMLLNIPEVETPVLLCRKDINPANIYLIHTTEVDYKKISKIDTDRAGNITLQYINGSTFAINYNDLEKLEPLLQNLSDTQIFQMKQLIGSEHKEILTEIRKIQDQSDEKNTIQIAENNLNDLDDFFKQLTSMKIENAKNNIITNYKLLREYEEMIILEDNPKRKMKYQKDMETIKKDIATNESELKSIVK